ncbi:hypothetical protein [Allomuricauda sp. SCSIO 65647]|uniref:hypothetical protein n=1 Tax=Allomuricauda sp. SCSIO 65647 TaxID=2908843 RepID=UPI001F18B6AE|nr:hypothetical protein [Muricauda sp. SCSIO 65647]UJH66813.1 hypothetical protein L0P89_12695 [Muricauda sp. SCSIO 65647]
MGKSVLVLVLFLLLLGCDEDDSLNRPTDLIGTWLLIEQYADPGDGSGDFNPVNSDKIIIFSAEGTYMANGSLCFMGTDSDSDVSGTYEINDSDLSDYSSENFLVPEDCNFDDLKVYIHLEENRLILSYLCIEGCAQKYRKI